MKKTQKQTPDSQRRAFLRSSATAGVGAAVAASLPGLTTASIDDEASAETPTANKGYRLTPHIAAYYKSTVS
ncbi:MAG: hypothetical protein ABW098_06580 [Candidatus Thiodiazotropha sp.]